MEKLLGQVKKMYITQDEISMYGKERYEIYEFMEKRKYSAPKAIAICKMIARELEMNLDAEIDNLKKQVIVKVPKAEDCLF